MGIEEDGIDSGMEEMEEEPGGTADPGGNGTGPGGGEEPFETTAEEATGFRAAAPFFDRKKATMALCVTFALVAGGGFVMNLGKSDKEAGEDAGGARPASAPSGFLQNELDRARAGTGNGGGSGEAGESAGAPEGGVPAGPGEGGLPGVSWSGGTGDGPSRPGGAENGVPAYAGGTGGQGSPPPPPPAPGSARQGGGSAPANTVPAAHYSPLVPPRIEGSLFGGGAGQAAPGQAAAGSLAAQYPYITAETAGQNAANGYLLQALAARSAAPDTPSAPGGGGREFYSAPGGGTLSGGFFLGENTLWPGTIVPGVLETAINTDLPGNAVARTTQNVYDSQTGRKLLIPQGSLLIARYNSSVSYAQSRVQIAWDTLIRPDGFYLELEGMNGVDRKGMSGQEAAYHENWFEYAKAAGLITMFSVASAKMAGEAAKHAPDSTASGIAQANAEFVNETGGNIVSRAMGIQPTLTVENGTPINIMTGRALYLPPAEDYPPAQKYTLR
jgi:hypothetical protein